MNIVKLRRNSVLVLLIIVMIILLSACKTAVMPKSQEQEKKVVASYMIDDVPVYVQQELPAGCEVYAGVVTLQYLGFDIDEHEFSNTYLITSPIWYDQTHRYGPDMNSAYAGTVLEGYGIYAPAMAKSMNNYLSAVGSEKRAETLKKVSLDTLCQEYVANNIPVMVWATTYMHEPYVKAEWVVDFVDENADTAIGEVEQWMQNEHCLVLVGFDKENYYFADSVSGSITAYEKEVSELRYEQLGSQAIVVK